MAKKHDYVPKKIDPYLTHHDNLKTQAAALVGQAGITSTDATNLATDNTQVHTAHSDVVAADSVKQAKVATQTAVVKTVVGNERKFANRVKAATGYTNAIGQQLGIIGEEDTTDLSTSAPTLTGKLITLPSGLIVAEIGFDKSISDGVKIFSRRGSETAFTPLAIDTSSPYVDNRPNLGAGPETRQYQAVYMLNDEPIGNMSAILSITVPASIPTPVPPPTP